jgi:thiol-disulfide isomerase/thioredoxin
MMERFKELLKEKLLAVILVLVAVGGSFLYHTLGHKIAPDLILPPETPGLPYAEDFTVEDIEGNEIRLSDCKGKPVILNFWASWCGPCRSEMPYFEEAFLAHGDKIYFLMVDSTSGQNETRDKAIAFLLDGGYSFHPLFDTKGSAARAYSLDTIPRTYAINENGQIVDSCDGALDRETLDGMVAALLGNQ